MTIINPLPYNIANGQAVDAVPVMADLNAIVNNVNANAAPASGSPNYAPASGSPNYATITGSTNYAPDTGSTANAYVVSLTPAIPATIPDGFPVNLYVTPARVNTGTATLNGVAIVDRNGNPILGGQIKGMCALEYSTAYAKWMFTGAKQNVSVLDFGADPTGTIDSTAAIQAAINSFGSGGTLPAASGGVVKFPAGHYLISNQILVGNIGIRLIGESSQSTMISVTANVTAAFKFTQTIPNFSDVSVGMSEFIIDMQGFNGHGIWMLKPYDTSGCNNVYVKNVGDAYNGVRIEPDSNNTADPVSQSLVFSNVEVAHKNTTATAPCWYLDTVQESQFIGCKGFAYFGASTSAAVPWYLQNCRGILGLGCSSSQTSGFGIEIATTTRNSGGIQFLGHTFESCAQILNASASSTYSVYEIVLAYLRNEGSGGGSTPIVLVGVTNSEIECDVFAVSLDANSHYNLIRSASGVVITNSGTGNVILEKPSAANSAYQILADAISLARNDATSSITLNSGNVALGSSGSSVLEAAYPFGASQAGMLLLVNRAGTVTLSQVTVGAADSGGTGFRTLLVPD